jgi:uncharacterized protein (TIGR02217 family)
MSFVERRLLDCVSYGTVMGPSYKTLRVALRSGKVRRKPLRSRPLYRFVLLYKNLNPEHHSEVLNAFHACLGGAHSFRMKDWSDFEANSELLNVVGTGVAQQVQLTKTYTFGSLATERVIRKPVVGTVTMTANGAPLAATIDYTTGIASFTAGNGDVLRWSGEFDVPVMFEGDELPFSGDDKGVDGLFLNGDVTLIEDTDA